MRNRNFSTVNTASEKIEKTITESSILGESETEAKYGPSEDVKQILNLLKALQITS